MIWIVYIAVGLVIAASLCVIGCAALFVCAVMRSRGAEADAAADAEYRRKANARVAALVASPEESWIYRRSALRTGLCSRAAFDVDEALKAGER